MHPTPNPTSSKSHFAIPLRRLLAVASFASAMPSVLPAAIYHVDPKSGSINSIDHVNNNLNLAPGDEVLFKKGESFEGKLIADVGGVTYGSYGTATAKPILRGIGTAPHTPDVIVVTGVGVIIQDLMIAPELGTPVDKSNDVPDHGTRYWALENYTVTNGIVIDGRGSSTAADNTIVRRCDFRHLARGVYFKRTEDNFPNNCKVSSCTFSQICRRWINQNNGVLEGAMAIDMQGNFHEVFDNDFDESGIAVEYAKTGTAIEVFDARYCEVYRNQAFNVRIFSEMGGKKPSTVDENTYMGTSRDNRYDYNLFVSDREGAKFLTTRGRYDVNGPVLRTKVYNNTIRLTYVWDENQPASRKPIGINMNGNQVVVIGSESYGGDEILYLRNNIITVQSPGLCFKLQGYFVESDSVYWGLGSSPGELRAPNYPGGPWSLTFVNTDPDDQSVNQNPNIDVNGGTFEINIGPCLDKGAEIAGDMMAFDLDKLPAPVGAGRDIGALEKDNEP